MHKYFQFVCSHVRDPHLKSPFVAMNQQIKVLAFANRRCVWLAPSPRLTYGRRVPLASAAATTVNVDVSVTTSGVAVVKGNAQQEAVLT